MTQRSRTFSGWKIAPRSRNITHRHLSQNLIWLPCDKTSSVDIDYARRLCDIGAEICQLVPFILPQSMARLSTQEEIDKALGGSKEGPTVFLATVLGGYTQSLKDLDRKPLTVAIPNETFFHQILICGKTGSGKTVAAKYLSRYFVEKMEGAVLRGQCEGCRLPEDGQTIIAVSRL